MYGFLANGDSAMSQKVFNITQTQVETKV